MIEVLSGDALERLREMADGSVQCCVTSPPYWGLREYGVEGQYGLEQTPEEYVRKMVAVFREVRRVLRKDGTLWLNLGDSYWGGKGENGSSKARATATERGYVQSGGTVQMSKRPSDGRHDVLKPKDLCGVPWRVAFALQADGWWLRSDIIWAKPNPMPESVTDRPTKAHEYVFLLTKSANYFYDAEAIKERASVEPHAAGYTSGESYAIGPMSRNGHSQREGDQTRVWAESGNRNKRSVWNVATAPYPEAHFATYPPDLIKPCIMAGCPQKVCSACLTPMVASGHVEQVAKPNTIQTQLQRVRGVLRGSESEILQQTLFDEGSRQATEAETSTVQAMRSDVRSSESRRPVLAPVLHNMAKGAGAIGAIAETDMAGRTPAELEGRTRFMGGVSQTLGSKRKEIQVGASNGYGTADGQEITESRDGASSQRNQDGQPDREFSSNDQESSHGNRHLSSLQGDVCDSLSPCCGAPWTPGTVLDCFAGSGTTGMVALELGRKAVLIELNPKYVALIEQRCDVTLGLALA